MCKTAQLLKSSILDFPGWENKKTRMECEWRLSTIIWYAQRAPSTRQQSHQDWCGQKVPQNGSLPETRSMLSFFAHHLTSLDIVWHLLQSTTESRERAQTWQMPDLELWHGMEYTQTCMFEIGFLSQRSKALILCGPAFNGEEAPLNIVKMIYSESSGGVVWPGMHWTQHYFFGMMMLKFLSISSFLFLSPCMKNVTCWNKKKSPKTDMLQNMDLLDNENQP